MAAPAHGRWGWMLLEAGVIFSLAVAHSWALEPVPLVSDYQAAVSAAKREGRLLFVLHFSGDFSAPPALGEEGKAYQALALSDERVLALLRERYVATFQQVGPPASLSLVAERKKKAAEPQQQHAMAYICLPDERVIHFVPGFVSATELLSELKWAESCYYDFIRFPAAEQPLAVRQMHLAAVSPADAKLYGTEVKTRWLLDSPVRDASAADLTAVVQGARQLRTTRLDERFGGPENALPVRAFYDALADHAGLEPSAGHLVLFEYPLVPLAQLAQPLYEAWTRDRFWQLQPRRQELKDWFVSRVGKGKPVLLAVTVEKPPIGEPERRQLIPWPPKDSDLPLEEFEILELSLDELTLLTADAGLPTLTAQRGRLPRFVVYDRAGRRRAVLTTSDGITRLRTVMRASAQPGVVAAPTETKDGRNK
ncbi:MAG TPA: hypothetical protein VFB96_17855 [Pirellulaceae bacterium]|nr:hypothetical protein [Pirellulaceae bacterium]